MCAVREGLEEALGVKDSDCNNGRSTKAQLLRSIFDPLLDDDAVEAVSSAAQSMSQEGRDALGWELQFVAESNFYTENVKTAKESLENLVKDLPDWIRELLRVLNEILTIVGRMRPKTSPAIPLLHGPRPRFGASGGCALLHVRQRVYSDMEEAGCRLQRARIAGRAVYELVFPDEVLYHALDVKKDRIL